MLKAHYYGSKARGYHLILTTGAAINAGVVKTLRVDGKRDARQVAKANNATPYNF